MSWHFPWQDHEDLEDTLIVDLRSDSIGFSFVDMSSERSKVSFLGRKRFPHSIEDSNQGKRMLTHVVSELGPLMTKIAGQAPKRPKKVVCVLSAPWFKASTRAVVYESNETFTFTERFSEDLINDEVKTFCDETGLGDHCTILENDKMACRLNGYETSSPYGKEAERARITVYMSLADKSLTQAIDSAISSAFHISDISYYTFPHVMSILMPRVLGPDVTDFVVADVSALLTEIIVIKDNLLVYQGSFPVGMRSMHQELAGILGTDMHDAVSLYKAYGEGRVGTHIKDKIKAASLKVGRTWKEDLIGVVKDASSRFLLPEKFVLLGDSDAIELFAEQLNDLPVESITAKNDPFAVTTLDHAALINDQYIQTTGEVDQCLLMDSLFVLLPRLAS